MGWLTLASGLVSLVNWVMDQLSRKQLIDQGEVNAIQSGLKLTLKIVQRAKRRRVRVAAMSDDELDNEL